MQFNRKTLRRDGEFSENLNDMDYKKQNMKLQILDDEIQKSELSEFLKIN